MSFRFKINYQAVEILQTHKYSKCSQLLSTILSAKKNKRNLLQLTCHFKATTNTYKH